MNVTCDVKELINESVDAIKLSCQRKGIEIITDINPEIPHEVEADKSRIKTVLQNLLSNSQKYTKQGQITLSAQLVSKGKLSQEIIQNNQMLCKFSVKDTGQGIEYEKQQHLFDLFGQIQGSQFDSNRTQSIGMGMFLSYQISYQLGQKELKVKSEPNVGTTVKFYCIMNYCQSQIQSELHMPQISQETGVRVSLSNVHNENEQIKTFTSQESEYHANDSPILKIKDCDCAQILLVDDTELIRVVLCSVFSDYKILEARDGQEAIQLVEQQLQSHCRKFELIVMDCQMPIMDGWEATKIIRKKGYKWPILGYTAYTGKQDYDRCIQVGMNEVLEKPTKAKQIIETFKKLTRKAFKDQMRPIDLSKIKRKKQQQLKQTSKTYSRPQNINRLIQPKNVQLYFQSDTLNSAMQFQQDKEINQLAYQASEFKLPKQSDSHLKQRFTQINIKEDVEDHQQTNLGISKLRLK